MGLAHDGIGGLREGSEAESLERGADIVGFELPTLGRASAPLALGGTLHSLQQANQREPHGLFLSRRAHTVGVGAQVGRDSGAAEGGLCQKGVGKAGGQCLVSQRRRNLGPLCHLCPLLGEVKPTDGAGIDNPTGTGCFGSGHRLRGGW